MDNIRGEKKIIIIQYTHIMYVVHKYIILYVSLSQYHLKDVCRLPTMTSVKNGSILYTEAGGPRRGKACFTFNREENESHGHIISNSRDFEVAQGIQTTRGKVICRLHTYAYLLKNTYLYFGYRWINYQKVTIRLYFLRAKCVLYECGVTEVKHIVLGTYNSIYLRRYALIRC